MWTSLTTYVPQVKERVCPNAPFGVSLRLSQRSAADARQEQGRARQAQEVPRRQQHVSLHGQRVSLRAVQGNQIVKEQVYEPDWRSEERTQYTMNVADILADVVPRGHLAVDPERAARLQAAT